MSTLPEFVGTIHIFLGPHRGNPVALYLRQEGESCRISPAIYPWNKFVGVGETANKAAADFDLKWKESDLTSEMYSGPHWEGGIKPEKPKPPPKPVEAKPTETEAAKRIVAAKSEPQSANLAENASANPNPLSTPPATAKPRTSAPQTLVPSEPVPTTNPSLTDQSTDKPTS